MHANGRWCTNRNRSDSRCRADRSDRRPRRGTSASHRTTSSTSSWPSAAWSTARRSKCCTICTAARKTRWLAVRAAGIGRPRGGRVSSAPGARRRAAAIDGRRRAARGGRLVQPVHLHAGRHPPRAHRRADRRFFAAAVHVRGPHVERFESQPGARRRRTCFSSNADGRGARGVRRRRRCSGSAAAAAATRRSTRAAGCIASPGSRRDRAASGAAAHAGRERRLADLCATHAASAPSWPIELAERGQASILVEAGQRIRISRWRLVERQTGPPCDRDDRSARRRCTINSSCKTRLPTRGEPASASCICGRSTFRTSDDAWRLARRLGLRQRAATCRGRWRGRSLPTSPPLWLVTGGAQAVDGACRRRSPSSSRRCWAWAAWPRWNFPTCSRGWSISIRRACCEQAEPAADASRSTKFSASTEESEIAYRDGQRFVARLVRDPSIIADDCGQRRRRRSPFPTGRPFQLRITQAGSFDALRFVPVEREPPQAGQVEIEVHADRPQLQRRAQGARPVSRASRTRSCRWASKRRASSRRSARA